MSHYDEERWISRRSPVVDEGADLISVAPTAFQPPAFQPTEHEMTLAEASVESGLACGTLRVLIHRRRMAGRKRGRDWFVTPSSLEAYLSSRDSRGRRPSNPKAQRR
jgi:hypothetical protein